MEQLKLERVGKIALITLCRPAKLNALTTVMLDGIRSNLDLAAGLDPERELAMENRN